MIKTISFILSLALLTCTQLVFAHGGGHGPIKETQAIAVASRTMDQFVYHDSGLGFGKLDKSWNDVSENDKRIHDKGDGYYIVSATNQQQGKTLYILMSVSGEVYDANFNGVFPGLK